MMLGGSGRRVLRPYLDIRLDELRKTIEFSVMIVVDSANIRTAGIKLRIVTD
jgi:hypothetical protein